MAKMVLKYCVLKLLSKNSKDVSGPHDRLDPPDIAGHPRVNARLSRATSGPKRGHADQFVLPVLKDLQRTAGIALASVPKELGHEVLLADGAVLRFHEFPTGNVQFCGAFVQCHSRQVHLQQDLGTEQT